MIADAPTSPTCDPFADYAVIGLGRSGRSVVQFLYRRGESVIAMDTREQPPLLSELRATYPALTVLTGELNPELVARSRHIVLSPGVSLAEPAVAAAASCGREIIGDIELFSRTAVAPIIAITGTNGKSTVTTLVADMLEASDFEVRRGGNLGIPALDLLDDHEPDFYVLEVSSFQLELTHTLAPRVACILNLAPDHLDRHGSFESYAQVKARVLERAQIAVLNADDPVVRTFPYSGQRIGFSLAEPGPGHYGLRRTGAEPVLAGPGGDVLALRELRITGAHNIANALAAVAIGETCGADRDKMIAVLKTFRGLPNRCEPVATLNHIQFINDSKATNPGAACASIAGLMAAQTGVIIAGGQSKDASFDTFADVAVAHAHTIVLIGRAASEIAHSVAGRVPCIFATDMDAAVRAAAEAADSGEVVLLAPACASFDMFDSYEARGAAFRQAVAALEMP